MAENPPPNTTVKLLKELRQDIDSIIDAHEEVLLNIYEDMKKVCSVLEGGRKKKRERIREEAGLNDKSPEYVSHILHTLREAGVIDTSGRGNGWFYKKR